MDYIFGVILQSHSQAYGITGSFKQKIRNFRHSHSKLGGYPAIHFHKSQCQPQKSINFFKLFRYADPIDYVLMIVGTICALLSGAAVSLFSLFWGKILDKFKTKDDLVEQTYQTLLIFVYIGLGIMFLGITMIACWVITGQRQSHKCKKLYLKSIFSQQIGWHQKGNQFEISSSFSVDTAAYQSSIGHNIPFIFNVIGLTISGLVIAFVHGWLMTLVIMVAIPLIVFVKYMYSKLLVNREKIEQKVYSHAGGMAQEGLYAIKTVKMLNGEQFESKKYMQGLKKSENGTRIFGLLFSLCIGGAFFFALSTFAFGLWYGSQCIRKSSSCPQSISKQQYTVGVVFTVFFCIATISFYLSHLPYNIKKVSAGIMIAQKIYSIIDREPQIKNPASGIMLQNFKGIIKFVDVTFSYPKQPNKIILNKLNMQINKNKIAFAGESGCGKSTIIQLLLRFYDPDSGYISVDGVNLKDIDLTWWREEVIGYVGQQPVLFAATITENLLFARPKSTQEQIQAALKKAQVFNFVSQLKKRGDTYVGSGGCQVSGGQKQRIAIARALVKKPKILILDEATSALDRRTERSIQKTLNNITQEIISITIAHRIKTIKNSDEIFILDKGKIKEHGKFENLRTFQGMGIEADLDQEQMKNEAEKELKNLKQNEESEKQKQGIKVTNTLKRLFVFFKGNYIFLLIATICTFIIGGSFPASTIFLAKLTKQMLIPLNPNLESQANNNSLIVTIIGAVGFIACVIQLNLLERVSSKISSKIRMKTYTKLLKLPISWHDREENNINSLSSKLSVGAYRIREIITTSLFAVMQIIFCLLSGVIIAFIYQWRTALINIAFLPIQMATAGFTAKYRNGQITAERQQSSLSGNINESIINIRTVYSLGYQKILIDKYSGTLDKPFKKNIRRALISGVFYGIGECLVFISISLLYHLAARFIRDNNVEPLNVFTVIFAIFFATTSIGQISTILPNLRSCFASSKEIFAILDQKDQQQIQIEQKSQMIKNKQIKGDIQLKNICFKYESRSQQLFQNLNMIIPNGKKVGFVGTSGCGKSTIISFLLRFYEPSSGKITIDGIDIKDFDIHYLRSVFGVVSQQPVLFNTSFKSNILYNMSATQQEILDATKKANALDFILKGSSEQFLEQYQIKTEYFWDEVYQRKDFKTSVVKCAQVAKFDTSAFNRNVGIKGSSISGGQKQRVAIARAILRKPSILLLDEATSALDSANEKIVTQCLNNIMENKTIISIAHRLQTLKDAALIYVFDKGIIAESGTYSSLLDKRGYFYNLEKGYELL